MTAPDDRSALMGTYAPAPVVFASGSGSELFDVDGRRYLDFLGGIAVVALGHSHPAVTAAVVKQAARLSHVSNLFANELAAPLAEALDRLVGDGTPLGGQVFFANSGAEANECAIKLARRVGGRGRHVVVSAYGSFHGRTLATLAATGQPQKHEPFVPMPEGFRHVAYGDIEALESAADPTSVAAILLEPIQGEAGVVVPPHGYLAAVRKLCDEREILLLLDEIQTGLGRTGRWFDCQHEGVVPDILTSAKALGNGMPIGACWARREVADAYEPGDHGSTFGGQPLACAAAMATLTTMEEIDAPRLALERGSHLSEALRELDGVASVRGRGLLLGAVLEDDIDASALSGLALSHGLVVNAPVPSVLRFAPAYTVTDDQSDEAAALLGQAIADARRRAPRREGAP